MRVHQMNFPNHFSVMQPITSQEIKLFLNIFQVMLFLFTGLIQDKRNYKKCEHLGIGLLVT